MTERDVRAACPAVRDPRAIRRINRSNTNGDSASGSLARQGRFVDFDALVLEVIPAH
jgi:hypothetical protein